MSAAKLKIREQLDAIYAAQKASMTLTETARKVGHSYKIGELQRKRCNAIVRALDEVDIQLEALRLEVLEEFEDEERQVYGHEGT